MEQSAMLARQWFEKVWNERDEGAIDRLADPDCVGYLEGQGDVGLNAFREARTALLGAFPDLRIVIADVMAEGQRAVVRWMVTATHGGDHLGLKATGKPVRFMGMTWLEFNKNGKVVRGWDCWNQGALVQSLMETAG